MSARFRVLIAGGGVAAVEAALALRDQAGDRVSITLLAPGSELVYRPESVRAPFAHPGARRYPLEEIARDLGAELVTGQLAWIDAAAQIAYPKAGTPLSYDALLVAVGASMRRRFAHAITIDDRSLDEQLHGLVQDVEGGYARHIAFLVPEPMPWPLPTYELALMTAARAYDSNLDANVTVLTPEESPLGLFGHQASEAVAGVLAENRVEVVTRAHCEVVEPGHIAIHPGTGHLDADRIVALPQLTGPAIAGLPRDGTGGFIPIDRFCRVRSLQRVFAAGDATTFPIKHGGIAAQQADTAAAGIAALAGVAIDPEPAAPEIRAILLGGRRPLYLSAVVAGEYGTSSQASFEPLWSPAKKIAARYLTPYLESRDQQPHAALT
jgi:sulfide:quinone oxidoreductase